MTEVQLLDLEAPTPAVKDTAARMLELVRRLTSIARTLDSVSDLSVWHRTRKDCASPELRFPAC